VARAARGEGLAGPDYLHTRYALDGEEAADGVWPNFQLDGFGTWLWALDEHRRLSGHALAADWLRAAGLVAEYLAALWPSPCYDCWEEFPDRVHPHTLAAIYGGLRAHAALSGVEHGPTQDAICEFLYDQAVYDGHFVKFVGSRDVDASLLGLAVPYPVLDPADP
jgi:GH15 family glucan-1,4-alpha-glucosidase